MICSRFYVEDDVTDRSGVLSIWIAVACYLDLSLARILSLARTLNITSTDALALAAAPNLVPTCLFIPVRGRTYP